MGWPAVYGMPLEGTGKRMNAIGGRFGTCPYCTPAARKQEIAAMMRMIGAPAGRRADYHWEQEATLLRTHS